MEQQRSEKLRNWQSRIQNIEQLTDQDCESILKGLFMSQLFDCQEIGIQLKCMIEKELHEEKKKLENFRDQTQKIQAYFT